MPAILSTPARPANDREAELLVQVDPLDLEGKTTNERIQMALKAIDRNGLKPNGKPVYTFREAARIFNVPSTTLNERYHGRKTRQEGHEHEKRLTDAQKEVLVEWIKEKGRRNIPLHLSAVAEHASLIAGVEISESYIRRFRTEMSEELKVRWTTGQEKCRASALNEPTTHHFLDMVDDLCKKYNIKTHHKYNMDEKGVQLGIGGRTAVLVDRDQKDVMLVEDGNRSMVTIMECLCADGTVNRPSVVVQGKRRDLEWGRVNPCNASISHSPKGWTDQELGSAWLEHDFEPETHAKLEGPDEYRLLILDGHNSHTTYRFCSFAEKHKIIIVCLPPHTTHALQPADVGAFGPLSSSWKAEVNDMTAKGIPIRKSNFLECYARARKKAFSKETILGAWKKTGISPLNRDAIPKSAFAPALNTTTKHALPVAVLLPILLEPIHNTQSPSTTPPPHLPEAPTNSTLHSPSCATPSLPSAPSSTASQLSTATAASGSFGDLALTDNETFAKISAGQLYQIVGLPAQVPSRNSKEELVVENRALRDIIDRCCYQMQRDYALKKLMENENGKLREQLFNKQGKQKKKQTTSYARHMTSEECMEALAMEDWKGAMRAVFSTEEFKAQKKRVEAECRRVEAEAKDAEKKIEKERKEQEKREKDAQKEAEKIEKAAQRKRDQEEKARVRKEEAEQKKREKEEEKKRKQKATGGKKTAAPAKKRQTQQRDETANNEEDEIVPTAPEPCTPAHSRLCTPTISSVARIRTPYVPVTKPRPPKPRPLARSAIDVDKGDRDDAEMFIIRRSRRIEEK